MSKICWVTSILAIWELSHGRLNFTFVIFFGLIKFLVPINIHSFVFGHYKIKSHFLVSVTFSLSILGTKTIDENF